MRPHRHTRFVALAAAACLLASGCHDDGPTGPSLPGDRLLVLRSGGADAPALILMTPDGRDARPVAMPPGALAGQLAPSPDGRRFAYIARDDGGQRCLSIVGIDGAQPIRTTACDAVEGGRPVWSPDGARVAVRMGDRVWIAPVGGRLSGHAVAVDAPGHAAPAWSPDGRRLALVVDGHDANDPELGWLATTTADGQPFTTRGNVHADSPVSWSPDGEWLAARARGVTSVDDLRLYGPGDGLATRLLVGADVAVVRRDLAWSPDGARLAFIGADASAGDGEHELDVYVVRMADGQLTRLTPESGTYAGIAWSPAGDRLAFGGVPGGTAIPGSDSDVWVVVADGTSAPVRVTAEDGRGESVVGWIAGH